MWDDDKMSGGEIASMVMLIVIIAVFLINIICYVGNEASKSIKENTRKFNIEEKKLGAKSHKIMVDRDKTVADAEKLLKKIGSKYVKHNKPIKTEHDNIQFEKQSLEYISSHHHEDYKECLKHSDVSASESIFTEQIRTCVKRLRLGE